MSRKGRTVARSNIERENSSEFIAPSFHARAPSYSYRRLKRAGLGEYVEKVSAKAALNEVEGESLARLSFPFLAALCQLTREECHRPRLRALLHVPLRLALARGDSVSDILALFRRRVKQAHERVGTLLPLVVTVDSWQEVDLRKLLSIVSEIHHEGHVVLGPSTSEIKLILQKEQSKTEFDLTYILDVLKESGIENLEGGSDESIHLEAAKRGFSLTFSHNFVRSRLLDERGIRTNDAPPEGFLWNVFEVRRNLVPTKMLQTWTPWSSWVLDSSLPKVDAPLGHELLRGLLLAKLLLPEVPFVRAPLSLVGLRIAELAFELGINDLGYVGADLESSEALGVVSWETFFNVFQNAKEIFQRSNGQISCSVLTS